MSEAATPASLPRRGWRRYLTPEEAVQYARFAELPPHIKARVRRELAAATLETMRTENKLRQETAKLLRHAEQGALLTAAARRRPYTEAQLKFIKALAAGHPRYEAARQAGLSPTRARNLAIREDILAEVAKVRREMEQQQAENVGQLIQADALVNVAFFQDVRSGKYAAIDPADLRLRLTAAQALLDRQVPKRLETKSQETLIIRLDSATIEAMQQALREDGHAVDITPDAPPEEAPE